MESEVEEVTARAPPQYGPSETSAMCRPGKYKENTHITITLYRQHMTTPWEQQDESTLVSHLEQPVTLYRRCSLFLPIGGFGRQRSAEAGQGSPRQPSLAIIHR